MKKVAVIMSVYMSDDVLYLQKSIASMLSQSYNSLSIFIAVDGPVKLEVEQFLKQKNQLPNIEVFYFSTNKGLATRLNDLIDEVVNRGGYSYVARMDADDISSHDRIAKQVDFFEKNKDVSVIGSDVIEIDSNDNPIFYKNMDSDYEKIVERIIIKCPLNHPSVLFRSAIFEQGFRYNNELKNTQDYYLWVDLIKAGVIMSNVNEPLLNFRVDDDFHSRRGLKKALNDVKSRLYAFRELNNISLVNLIHVIKLFALRLAPSFIKKLAYQKLR